MNDKCFINREEEISEIERCMGEWGTLRILFITGEGGVGKTTLLEHLLHLWPHERQERARVLITERLDFDDSSLHVSESLGREVATQLGRDGFDEYLDRLLDWRKLEMSGISKARLAEEGELVDRAFVESFNRVSLHHRVVLLLDTMEKLQGTDVWFYDLKLASQLRNAVILMASRDTSALQAMSQAMGEEQVRRIDLHHFDKPAARQYLQRRQRDMPSLLLDAGTAQKILSLARGNLLLIDLALEWLARDLPVMRWLNGKVLEEVEALAREKPSEWKKVLISPISKTSTDRDRLLLMMAFIDPLDKEICHRLFDWNDTLIDAVWADVERLHFVKHLPHGKLRLHDVIRDMILDHIRPEIDLEQEQRWAANAVCYLDDLRAEWRQEMLLLQQQEEEARKEGNNLEAWEVFAKLEAVERGLWVFDGQYLGYRFLMDPRRALEAFDEMWQAATYANRLSYRGVLLSPLQQFENRLLLSQEQKYRIDMRRAQHFLDHAMYQQAYSLLMNMLRREIVREVQEYQVQVHIQLGNVVIRQGRFEEGETHFSTAVELSAEQGSKDLLVQSLNALGWVFRLMGRIDEAAKHYRRALDLALELEDRHREASILNNMSWAYALLHRRDAALDLSQRSIELWTKLDMRMGLAASYGTLGEVLTEFGDYEEALDAYNRALDIYSEEESKYLEGLAGIRCGRGATLWLLGRFDDALHDLEKAREIGLKRFEPVLLHRLAHVYLDRGQTNQAKELFEQSREISSRVPDPFYELNSLGDLAAIAIEEKRFDRADEFERRWRRYKSRHKHLSYPLPKALMLIYLGSLHLAQGDVNKSISHYLVGFPLIAKAGTYYPYTLIGQSERLAQRVFPYVDDGLVREVGLSLEQAWKDDEELLEKFPQILPIFAEWKRWRGTGAVP